MRVLAFDPGFERLGVAVIEKAGSRDSLLFSECVRTSTSLPFPERLGLLGKSVEAAVIKWEPSVVALENLYFEKNAKTAMNVAAVRGMLVYIAAHHRIPVYEYTPLQVKVAMTGHGKSDKRAVALMVSKLITLPTTHTQRLDDEIDAIAVGLTCLASLRS